MRSKKFISLVCVQVLIILLLMHMIAQKYTARYISDNRINSNTIKKTKTKDLKYFYEPIASTNEEVHKNWLKNTPIYTINKDTLNERFDYPIQKDAATFRIITLGDSFTFGSNMDTKDNWTEILEDKLNSYGPKSKKFEVINLGVRGYDIQYMNERFIRRGSKYSPDLVIVLLGDFQLRLNERMEDIIEKIKKDEPTLNPIALQVRAIKTLVAELGLGAIVQLQKVQYSQLISSIAGKTVLMKFPIQCENGVYKSFGISFSCSQLKQFDTIFVDSSIKNNDIHFLNNIDWKSEYSLQDGHPNKLGHAFIAQYIFNYLTSSKLLPKQ
jgi:hypothetical protein